MGCPIGSGCPMGLGMGLIPYPLVGSWVTCVPDKDDGHGSSLG
jgi:hypothetical protein